VTKVTPNALPYNHVRATARVCGLSLCRTPVSKVSYARAAGVRCAVPGPVRAEGRLGDSQAAWHVLPAGLYLPAGYRKRL